MTDNQQQAAHLANAQHYLLIGQWVRARDAASRSLAANPENASAHAVLAIALGALGEREAAEREAELAIQYNPGGYYMYYARGQVAAQFDDWITAERYFREALDHKPDESHLRQDIAESLLQQSRLEEAWTLQQQVLVQHPEEAQSHLLAARIAILRKDTPAVKQHLAATLRLDPENAGAQRLYAYVQYQGTNLTAGTEALRNSLQLDPLDETAQQTLKLFETVQHPFFRFFMGAEETREMDNSIPSLLIVLALTYLFAAAYRFDGSFNPLLGILSAIVFHFLSFFAAYWCLCALLLYPHLPNGFSWWKRILNGFGVIFFLLLPGAYWLVPKL